MTNTGPTFHVSGGTSPTARLRDKLAEQMPHIGAATADPARAAERQHADRIEAERLLAEAISTAEAINRDPSTGRYVAAPAMRPNPAQGTSASGATPSPTQQTPLERIRSLTARHDPAPPAA